MTTSLTADGYSIFDQWWQWAYRVPGGGGVDKPTLAPTVAILSTPGSGISL
jgi:hypothetical protein